jgi:spermidine/putrescine transport system ATP-binding protein
MQGWSKSRRRERAMELLATVALAEQSDKTPAQLSGGQKQRVAIARALAVEPAVLLLDEPLSALDLKLRQHMRAELKQIQERTGITFVYITHDQGEALTMSDRIAVMNRGRIIQVGSADDIYGQPANAFVATFVGETNMLRGRVSDRGAGSATLETAVGPLKGANPHDLAQGEEAVLFVRPERMRLLNGDASENRMTATLARRDMEGAYSNLILTAGEQQLTVHLTNKGIPTLPEGPVSVGFSAADGMILPVGEIADE